MAPITQRDQVEDTLIAVALVGVVVDVQTHISISASLTAVAGSR